MSSIIKHFLSTFSSSKGEGAVAKQIKLRAEEFSIEYANAYGGLDFSSQSLNTLDGLLSDIAAKWDDLQPAQQNELLSNIGSYILWTAYKQFDGKFYWSQEYEQPVFVVGEPDFRLALLPAQKIKQKITSQSSVSMVDYYKNFAQQATQTEKGTDKLFT